MVMTAMGWDAARAVVELKSSHTNNKSCLVLLRFAKEASLHLDCFPGLVRLVIFLAPSSLCRFFYYFLLIYCLITFLCPFIKVLFIQSSLSCEGTPHSLMPLFPRFLKGGLKSRVILTFKKKVVELVMTYLRH